MNEISAGPKNDSQMQSQPQPEARLDSQAVLDLAMDCGFDLAGISEIEISAHEKEKYRRWLDAGNHGGMEYLKNGLEIRENPRLLLDTAMSVISLGLLYRTPETVPSRPDCGIVSRYALGRDYHKVMRGKLKDFCQKLERMAEKSSLRCFTDSAPVFEKLYAAQAGLGVRGKNSLVISPHLGSEFFIGEVLISLGLEACKPLKFEPCKSCVRCVEACPAGAILDDRQINASKCIAYLTIEHKDAIPEDLCPSVGLRIFGCDECQRCCPWNRRHIYTREKDFACRLTPEDLRLDRLLEMTEEEYLKKFEGSVIRRAGWIRFMRNVIVAAGNSGNPNLIAAVDSFRRHDSPVLSLQAEYASRRLEATTSGG
ncbi:MAG: tRNA epoxyqueuosine(34) reductase QueG [Succinivibrionaceae bacterium]|nr:tRNA epoxyqueuosine(34) reductase QueG [Succinivibrionaceae bacterium]